MPDRRFVVDGRQVDRPDPSRWAPTPPTTYPEVKARFATYADMKARARQLRRRAVRLDRRGAPATSCPGRRTTYESRRPPEFLDSAAVLAHRSPPTASSSSPATRPRCRCRSRAAGHASTAPPSRAAPAVTIPWSAEIAEELGIDIRTLPLGGYALVRRGLRYADGTTELVAARPAAGRVGLLGHARHVRRPGARRPHGAGPRRAVHGPVRRQGQDAGRGRRRDRAAVFGASIAYHTPYKPTEPDGRRDLLGDRAPTRWRRSSSPTAPRRTSTPTATSSSTRRPRATRDGGLDGRRRR